MTLDMEIEATSIADVKCLRPAVHSDSRGFFLETWNHRHFLAHGLDLQFVQDNHSHSKQGTLRGLHYQLDQPQGKLCRSVSGDVFDVVVDLRKHSPSFGQWTGQLLSAERHEMLWVPPGFAHGFLVLSETADFVYKCTDYYSPESEVVIAWDDPVLAIDWPFPAGVDPVISARDHAGVAFRDAEYFQ